MPKFGDTRIVKKFAFYPVKADSSWIWLKLYFAKQKYMKWKQMTPETPVRFWAEVEGWRTIDRHKKDAI